MKVMRSLLNLYINIRLCLVIGSRTLAIRNDFDIPTPCQFELHTTLHTTSDDQLSFFLMFSYGFQ